MGARTRLPGRALPEEDAPSAVPAGPVGKGASPNELGETRFTRENVRRARGPLASWFGTVRFLGPLPLSAGRTVSTAMSWLTARLTARDLISRRTSTSSMCEYADLPRESRSRRRGAVERAQPRWLVKIDRRAHPARPRSLSRWVQSGVAIPVVLRLVQARDDSVNRYAVSAPKKSIHAPSSDCSKSVGGVTQLSVVTTRATRRV